MKIPGWAAIAFYIVGVICGASAMHQHDCNVFNRIVRVVGVSVHCGPDK